LAASAVALVLRDGRDGTEVLFIVRSSHDHDPWSGNIAFPGGRVDAADPSHRATAEREAMEELALSLEDADFLGELEQIVGTNLPVTVSCYVYRLTGDLPLHPNHEVEQAFWLPLATLRDPRNHRLTEVAFQEKRFLRPALHILPPGGPVLWGITYRLLASLLERLGTPLPPIEPPPPSP
jgi:8-oxo-dGTP pyrophosphatase MutT (NUDIX family)